MHISKIKINNYRNFWSYEMNFQKGLNVIIGANNSGKTNLLKAIQLLKKPNSITVHDFNKNYLYHYIDKMHNMDESELEPPKITLSYQVEHQISEKNTEDENILNLVSFLGFDDIEEQKEKASKSKIRLNEKDEVFGNYKITANIKAIYKLKSERYKDFYNEIHRLDNLSDFINVLERYLQYYEWHYENGDTGFKAKREHAQNIFEIIFIEAERQTEDINREIERIIRSYERDPENTSKMQDMKLSIKEMIEETMEGVLNDISGVIEAERGEVGLQQGGIKIGQDIEPAFSIADTYQLTAEDTLNNYILPMTHNGVGYNNLIYIYMLLNLEQLDVEKGARILCFEEPEVHLHPAMQYKLFSYLNKMSRDDELHQQIFVSTHSSNITAVAGLDNIYVLDYKQKNDTEDSNKGNEKENMKANVVSVDLEKQFKNRMESKEHLAKFLDVTRSDMLFADKVILVEGISEKLLLPKLIKNLGCRYEDHHISIVEIGGTHFDYFLDLFRENDLNKKVLCITDKDYPFSIDNPLKSLEFYQSEVGEHINKLQEEYQENQNFKFVYQKAYGQTFEDELLYYNLKENNIKTAKKMLKIAFGKHLNKFLSQYDVDFDTWKNNEDNMNNKLTKPREYIEKFVQAIEAASSEEDKEKYKKLFFAKLFLYYASGKKGEVALKILVNEKIMKSIVVPAYIKEGIKWLLK